MRDFVWFHQYVIILGLGKFLCPSKAATSTKKKSRDNASYARAVGAPELSFHVANGALSALGTRCEVSKEAPTFSQHHLWQHMQLATSLPAIEQLKEAWSLSLFHMILSSASSPVTTCHASSESWRYVIYTSSPLDNDSVSEL